MTAIRENSTMKQIVIGVIVAVVTAIILGVLGLKDDGGGTVVIQPDSYRTVNHQTPTTPTIASLCVTPYGNCPLVQRMTPGMSCICYDIYGYPRLAGTAQ